MGKLLQVRHWFRVKSFALALWLDEKRVRQHLKRVERQLRADNVTITRPEQLQIVRRRNLDRLQEYWKQGVFPRNESQPNQMSRYAPRFIDHNGRLCAVAHLVVASGHAEAAHHIANVANDAYIEEMKFPELDAWATASGLSKDELARIQPAYMCSEECIAALPSLIATYIASNLWWIMIGGITGTIVSVANIVNINRKRWKPLLYGSILGILVGAALIYLAVTILQFSAMMDIFGVPCDGVPGGLCSIPKSQNIDLREMTSPFIRQSLVSCILGSLVAFIGLYGLPISIPGIIKKYRATQRKVSESQ